MNVVLKRASFFFISAALAVCLSAAPAGAAGKKAALSSKKVTLSVGKSKKIKLNDTKGKVKWEVTKGKRLITLKKKSSSGVTITAGKKTGAAVVQGKVGKKKYSCKVTVTKKAPKRKAAKTKAVKKKTTGKAAKSKTTKTKTTADKKVKQTAPAKKKEEKLIIEVGKQKFEAVLYNNKAVQAWKKKLPMTLSMSELNRNEKYHYLSYSLPTKPEKSGIIQAGDLKLYGSDCLVLFYQTFQTAYSYTKIARINNIAGLQNALGTGSVSVTFRLG